MMDCVPVSVLLGLCVRAGADAAAATIIDDHRGTGIEWAPFDSMID